MKKRLIYFTLLLSIVFVLNSCNGNNSDNSSKTSNQEENIDNGEGILDEDPDFNYDEDMVEAKFISADCFEGECDYNFVVLNSNGEPQHEISFFYNAFDPEYAQIDYEFFNFEELTSNEAFVGKIFIINYKFVPDGKLDIATGELVDCNVITNIELK